MALICFEENEIYKLADDLYARIVNLHKKEDKWISGEEAMKLLRVTSKATLQKYRDEDRIRFSQPDKKIILYDRESILEFLNDNSNKPQ